MKFLCDEMLGTLAKWLRIIGFDTIYVKNISDNQVCAIAKKEQRFILTRDWILANNISNAYYVQPKKLDDQVRSVVNAFQLSIDEKLLFSRCTICNIPVKPVVKETIKSNVPPSIYDNYDTFWICLGCGRVYWLGSHWADVTARVKNFR